MFYLLFNYFNNLLIWGSNSASYNQALQEFMESETISINGSLLTTRFYLAFLLALISFIIIVVLCCLFIKKIISLMARLFTGN